jgi:hypothetical protein
MEYPPPLLSQRCPLGIVTDESEYETEDYGSVEYPTLSVQGKGQAVT